MSTNSQYSLLIIADDDYLFDFKNSLNKENWNITISNLNEYDNLSYDLIINLYKLEIYYGFNNDLILKINDINSLEEEITSAILELKSKDFDLTLALDMLGNSKKVYDNILINYLNEYKNLENELIEFLNNTDYEAVRMKIHKIKGVSLYLGSEKLLEFSKEIEYKIYNNLITHNDINKFINYHNRILVYVKEQVENV